MRNPIAASKHEAARPGARALRWKQNDSPALLNPNFKEQRSRLISACLGLMTAGRVAMTRVSERERVGEGEGRRGAGRREIHTFFY